jgi:hypothetical protein
VLKTGRVLSLGLGQVLEAAARLLLDVGDRKGMGLQSHAREKVQRF